MGAHRIVLLEIVLAPALLVVRVEGVDHILRRVVTPVRGPGIL